MMSFSVDMRDAIVGLAFSRKFPSFFSGNTTVICTYLGGCLALGADSHTGVLARMQTTTMLLRPNEDAVQVFEGIMLPQGS